MSHVSLDVAARSADAAVRAAEAAKNSFGATEIILAVGAAAAAGALIYIAIKKRKHSVEYRDVVKWLTDHRPANSNNLTAFALYTPVENKEYGTLTVGFFEGEDKNKITDGVQWQNAVLDDELKEMFKE
ncbi:MAG: hypothetical protein IJ233_01210, partial [Pyramidobacter sp.]|nr:hypothetical protein [Pyramidobacter sp.]